MDRFKSAMESTSKTAKEWGTAVGERATVAANQVIIRTPIIFIHFNR